eukprot:4345511-Amphidinium_carterae.1
MAVQNQLRIAKASVVSHRVCIDATFRTKTMRSLMGALCELQLRKITFKESIPENSRETSGLLMASHDQVHVTLKGKMHGQCTLCNGSVVAIHKLHWTSRAVPGRVGECGVACSPLQNVCNGQQRQ